MSVGEKPRRWKRWLRYGVQTTLAVGVAAIVSVLVLLRGLGDPAPGGLRIENRTEETVVVYSVGFDERIVPLLTLGPRSSVQSGVGCPTELVAQTRIGVEIERRPKPTGCHLDPWTIDGAW